MKWTFLIFNFIISIKKKKKKWTLLILRLTKVQEFKAPKASNCATLIVWKLNVRAMDTVAPSSSERLIVLKLDFKDENY